MKFCPMLGTNCWFEYTIVQKIAIKRFAPGPAKATHSISFLGFRKLEKLTGTGFAQPKIKPACKKNMLWVALAGPGANLLMAIFWTIVYSNQQLIPSIGQNFISVMAVAGIQINIVLMVLNLLPLPPLDGGRVAVSLLPYPWSSKLAGLERYGFFILIFLLATGLLGAILSPLIRVSQNIILTIFG